MIVVIKLLLTFLFVLKPACSDENLTENPNVARVCSRIIGESCSQLARGGELACFENYHNVDCLLSIANNQSHLGALKPEEAFLGAGLINDNVWVIGEERTRTRTPPQFVVIVKDNIQSGFNNLKGLKYCHPGFKNDQYFTNLMLQQFENAVSNLDGQFCKLDNATLVEKHIKAISSFFGSSCRPGIYTQDEELDRKLKAQYPSLCSLCDGGSCNVDYKNPMEDVLNCFSSKGDIAVTTIEAVKKITVRNFKYICLDGTISDTQCIWTNQLPQSVIVANIGKAAMLRETLNNTINDSNPRTKELLFDILDLRKFSTYSFDIPSMPLREYVKQFKAIPDLTSNKKCDLSLKWCTKSVNETEKCNWLSQAALNQGLQPVIECHQTGLYEGVDGELSCINDLKNGNADVFTAGADYGYIAYKNGLKAIAYPETDTRFVYSVVIVLKPESTTTTVAQLKGAKACIPEYSGKEWLVFVDYLRKNRLEDPVSNDFDKLISEFAGESCMPGAKSTFRVFGENVDKEKMCNQCVPIIDTLTAKYCNDDDQNKYYGNEGALRCLDDNAGDYAVISTNEVQNGTGRYKILCKNNTVVEVTGGLKVDEDCALSVIIASEVVARNDNKNNPDYVLLLRDIENIFGISLNKPFQVFNVFNKTRDLLFKDSTPGILFSSTNKYIDNFKSLLYSLPDVDPDSGANNVVNSAILIACTCVFTYIFSH